MINKEKHWETSAVFAVDFADRLDSGETLASGATFVVTDALDGASGADVTIGSVAISGTKVVGTISGGKCLEQFDDARWECRYLLKARVVTSTSERESDVVMLTVYDCIERSTVYTP